GDLRSNLLSIICGRAVVEFIRSPNPTAPTCAEVGPQASIHKVIVAKAVRLVVDPLVALAALTSKVAIVVAGRPITRYSDLLDLSPFHFILQLVSPARALSP